MKIPFLDLKLVHDNIKTEVQLAINNVIDNGIYVGGEHVNRFENSFANYCNAKYCVGTGNGLDSIRLSLMALEIGDGDEVIVPAHTFIATWLAVTYVGARIVPVDVSIDDFNIDINLIEKHITSKTKAIITVHLYGQPSDLNGLSRICNKHNLYLIEDAAQAHGARYLGNKIGAYGDIVCWSFYPGKNLGAMGDAGAVTSNNKLIADKVRQLSNYGSIVKYTHDYKGCNTRLDSIQAAILDVKLKYLDNWNFQRSKIAEFYINNIKSYFIKLPIVHRDVDHSWHLFVILTNSRDRFIHYLSSFGIQCGIHYPVPCFKQKSYFEEFNKAQFQSSEFIASNCVSLPIGPHLSIEQCDYICKVINDYKE